MKYAHLIKLTAFSYEDDNNQSILDAFLKFFPFSLEDNKVILMREIPPIYNWWFMCNFAESKLAECQASDPERTK